jgi:hypothetical protein
VTQNSGWEIVWQISRGGIAEHSVSLPRETRSSHVDKYRRSYLMMSQNVCYARNNAHDKTSGLLVRSKLCNVSSAVRPSSRRGEIVRCRRRQGVLCNAGVGATACSCKSDVSPYQCAMTFNSVKRRWRAMMWLPCLSRASLACNSQRSCSGGACGVQRPSLTVKKRAVTSRLTDNGCTSAAPKGMSGAGRLVEIGLP